MSAYSVRQDLSTPKIECQGEANHSTVNNSLKELRIPLIYLPPKTSSWKYDALHRARLLICVCRVTLSIVSASVLVYVEQLVQISSLSATRERSHTTGFISTLE